MPKDKYSVLVQSEHSLVEVWSSLPLIYWVIKVDWKLWSDWLKAFQCQPEKIEEIGEAEEEGKVPEGTAIRGCGHLW